MFRISTEAIGRLVIVCTCALMAVTVVQAENRPETNRDNLLELSELLQDRLEQRRTQLYWDLLSSDDPVQDRLNRDRDIQLMFIDERGLPRYYKVDNYDAAESISTDSVWPGGSGGYDLTGSGTATSQMAVWDGGGVRVTHQEFGGRVTQQDFPGSTHYHATHVAGTMMGAGVSQTCPDLRPSVFTLSGSPTVAAGESIGSRLAAELENIGLTSSGPFSVGLCISTNSFISLLDVPLAGGDETVSSVAPGSAQSVTFYGSTTIPEDWPAGTAWIGVYADQLEEVSECHEFNNSLAIQVLVTPGFSDAVNYGAGSRPWSVFSIDLDGDGDNDLAVTNVGSDDVSILKNNGDGTFQSAVNYSAGDGPYSVFSIDLDGDGDNDLAVANAHSDNISILKNNGDGTFQSAVNYSAGDGPASVFSIDLDGDGDNDLAVANYLSDNISILANNGDGTFQAAVSYGAGDRPESVFSVDLDGDGDNDLAVANATSDDISILKNNGDGSFQSAVSYSAGDGPRSVFSIDLDGDGDNDLAVANRLSSNISILKNNGDGTFQSAVNYSAGLMTYSVFSIDLDGDGDNDLAVANATSDDISILRNNGDGTFQDAVNYSVGNEPLFVFSIDLDGDADNDLAVTNFSSDNISILMNRTVLTGAAARSTADLEQISLREQDLIAEAESAQDQMGASGLTTRGMSYEASLGAYDWDNDESEMASAAANGLLVSNHSYGFINGWHWNSSEEVWYWYGDIYLDPNEDPHFGYYDYAARDWDQIAYDAPYYTIVKSAGNDRSDNGPGPGEGHYYRDGGWIWTTEITRPGDCPTGYDCVGGKASAKNLLTIGAVNDIPNGYAEPADVVSASFTGWGPTDDGRIKPDLVANGINLLSPTDGSDTEYTSLSGTSMSSPSVSGSLNLLIRHYEDTHNSETPLAATVKAVVLNTTDEAGLYPGPDYEYGWGLMNTLRAADLIDADGNSTDRIIEAQLVFGASDQYDVVSDGSSPLRITIVWTDVPGSVPPYSIDPPDLVLVNDLDIRLEHVTSSTVYYPWILDPAYPANAATRGDNFRDNVEQILIDVPPAGDYVLTVSYKGTVFAQDYSLASSAAFDLCPSDPNKTSPGQCGCGVPDTDTDQDGVADCVDICAGFDDLADRDGDEVPDGCDNCPDTPNPDQADEDENDIGDACQWCCGHYDPEGLAGNVNYDPDGVRDLTDILMLASYAFLSGDTPPCLAEMNVDGDQGCVYDLSDILALASYAFLSGADPAACMPECEQ